MNRLRHIITVAADVRRRISPRRIRVSNRLSDFRSSIRLVTSAATTKSFAVMTLFVAFVPSLAALELELRPAAQVDSSGIYLHQLVSGTPAELPTQYRLADAPALGRAVSISAAQITEALRQANPKLAAPTWTGASQVRVTRRTKAFGEAELRDLLTATLQSENVKDRGTLELTFGRPWAALQLPDENLTLRVLSMPTAGVSPNFIVRFDLSAGAERFGPWQIITQARIMKDVAITRLPLKRGQPLQASDFTIERRDLLALRDPFDVEALNNSTLELIENVNANQPLLARSIRMRPVVQRGQFVDGLVRDGTMNIALKVEALADGLPGQTIRVRNPKTRREFYAKVQDEQTVLISL